MVDITAVILAAGLGIRMGARGRIMPKPLIEIGGATMIQQSIDALRDFGVERIVIVTGHLQDQFQAIYGGSDVELIHNPLYATTGSLRSLMTGLGRVDGACLIVEGDLLYSPQVLAPVDPNCNRFIISGPTGAGDEQWVWARPGPGGRQLLEMISKNGKARPGPIAGEMVGLICLNAETVPVLREVARAELVRNPCEHYEPGLVALTRIADLECVSIGSTPWGEVDNEAMLERVTRLVYPRIRAARSELASP